MGIELWFKDDIRNILLSLDASSAGAANWGVSRYLDVYRQGYHEALCAVALACGIPAMLIGTRAVQSGQPGHKRYEHYSLSAPEPGPDTDTNGTE